MKRPTLVHTLVCAIASFVSWLTWANAVYAHESAPAVLALKQVANDRFVALWTPPFPPIPELTVHLPTPCTLNGSSTFERETAPLTPTLLDCAGKELVGEARFTSAQSTIGPVAVNIQWLDGTESMHLSRGTPATVALGGTASSQSAWQVVRAYAELGVEHILFGVDHLLFVFGLLLLVNGWKSLLTTISAFTLAHSITLATATLGVVSVSTAPVEIAIALSILLLAIEIAHKRDTLTRRKPWLVAFGFGLLHGLGFASALSDVGLPRHAVALSLFAFNVGVELGQLAVVAVAAAVSLALRRQAGVKRGVEWAAVGLLTASSVFWLLQRVNSWLAELGVATL
jgi:hydrogenase/urease accessory protein HupE